MAIVRNLVVGALAAVAIAASASVASAQHYYYPAPQPRYYQQYPQYQHQGYVDPRIQRKQLQQQKRFIQKYGYQQPQYGYAPYRQPRSGYYPYQQPDTGYYPYQQPRARHQQRGQYHYGNPGGGTGYNSGMSSPGAN